MTHEMAIEAPKQEPCDDVISRKDLLRHLYDCKILSEGISQAAIIATEGYVAQMPSVTPVRPKGHWICNYDFPDEDWKCDVCGRIVYGAFSPYDFCPNCGADMREE